MVERPLSMWWTAMLVYKTMAKCRSFCKIESNSQNTFFAVVLYTNMAAVASRENREYVNVSGTVVGDDWCISLLAWTVVDWSISVRIGTEWVLCCLIVGIHASRISIPLSLLMLSVVSVKSYLNSLFNPTCVPMRVSINKLNFFPERIVPGHITVFWNSGWLCSEASRMFGSCSLIRSNIDLLVSP